MGKLIQIFYFNIMNNTKGDKMCKELIREIRKKPNDIKDMSDRAQEVLKYFKITDFSSGTPIVDILKKLGFTNYQSELEPNGLSAYIAVDPAFKEVYGSDKITCVHIKRSVGHKRFALAHELGHYLFDFTEEDTNYYNTYFPQKDENNFKEKRANAFAANLLMPENEFLKKLDEYWNLYHSEKVFIELSQYFIVSITAIKLRCSELNVEKSYSETVKLLEKV